MLDTPLVRLQCYEGIDAAEALYEWNYPRQLLSIRLADARGSELREEDLFGPDYLIRRPLLRALEHPGPRPAVLLVDEIDRADDDFEAFLLELLAEAAVTIPEIGTIVATHPPVIVLTSNRTRDLHDAVKRRCLYHWIEYPERRSGWSRSSAGGCPDAPQTLAVQVANAVSRMRATDVQKPPGIAEAIDWLAALNLLGVERLDAAVADRTLGSVLKYGEDQEVVRGGASRGSWAAVTDATRPEHAFGVETIELDLPRARRRVLPPPARRRHAGHARARGRPGPGARARPPGEPPAALLDGPRGARLRPGRRAHVRRRLRAGVRRRPAATSAFEPDDARRRVGSSDDRPATERAAGDGGAERDDSGAWSALARGVRRRGRGAEVEVPARRGERRGAAGREAASTRSHPASWPSSTS